MYRTTSYQTETPKWLWQAWTAGPASDTDRYSDRLTALVARDVLEHAPEQLADDERRDARKIIEEVDGDVR